MKVLVSAYACEPNKGSEPGLGWNWAKQIARFHQVWVITRANNQPIIEEELKKNPIPNIQFHYLDLPEWMKFWKKGTRGLYLYYYLWQIAAYFSAKKLHAEVHFDIAHHITFGNNWMPSFISLLPVSFVWGPVGSEDMPKALISELDLKDKIYEFLRFSRRKAGHYLDPFVRMTIKRSKIILDCNSKWTKNIIPAKYQSKIITVSQNGIEIEQGIKKERMHPHSNSKRFTILLVAKLVKWKGVSLACRAFIEFYKKYKKGNILIIGDGPEKKNLITIFKKNALLDKVTFLGQLSMHEFLQNLEKGDVFLYPSFHHGQATVILQAMRAGLPIICLNCDTIGETVTEECGIKIKPENPEQVVSKLAEALELLASNQKLRKQLGESAKKRVKEVYDWDKKGEIIKKIYQQYLEKNAAK